MKSEARLTFWEATSIIIGHGVGSGILSIPFLASRNSLLSMFVIIVLVYFINLLLHYMVAEMSYNNGGMQFIKCFENEIFKGKLQKLFTWIAFALLGLSVMVNISGFITGAGAVLTAWFGLPRIASQLIFYVLATAVVFAGMKLVGIFEKAAVIGMGIVIVILVAAVCSNGFVSPDTGFRSWGNVLALYSMVSFSLSAVMSVPQVVKGLDGDTKKIRKAIAAGTGINLLLVIVITMITLYGAGTEITQDGALVDLSAHLGGWVGVIGYIFSLLALATSFWANTLNLRDVVNEQVHIGEHASWAVASLPSVILALLGVASFVGFTRMAGIVQVLTGFAVIASYGHSRKVAQESLICKQWGTLPFQIIVLVSSLLATVGSLISVV